MARLREDPAVRGQLEALENAVGGGQLSPRVAAQRLVMQFWKDGKEQ
jgi:hypothetical protein